VSSVLRDTSHVCGVLASLDGGRRLRYARRGGYWRVRSVQIQRT